MKDKRKWEVTYEEYKSQEKQLKFEDLKFKFENNSTEKMAQTHMKKEEFDEYQKMKRIMDNLPKVDNLKEYMDRLENDFSKLKKEYDLRTQQGKDKAREDALEKYVVENMKQQEEAIARRKEVSKKIAEAKEPEEKAKLEGEKEKIDKELSELRTNVKENNKEFADLKSKEGQYNFDKSLKDYSMEDLKYNCQEIRTTISKCNLVASNLMKGLSIESIQPKLEGWKDRKLTSKDPLPVKAKQQEQVKGQEQDPAEAEKGRQGLAALVGKSERNQEDNGRDDDEALTDIVDRAYNRLPAKQYTFEEAFPRLAKLFPKLANTRVGKKMLEIKQKRDERKVEREQEDVQSEPESNQQSNNNQEQQSHENNQEQQENNKSENDKRKEFRSYIKYNVLDVAERGFDTVRQEDLEKRREEMQAKAKVKSEEMKKQQMEAREQQGEQQNSEDAR